ncbi:MAG: FtsQ-type POTRA domain-containing protein [Lachnospiraceae bacterium]|nr:FtsQ-type POTRA domain-containing protein [Lachnospiraceae bacterium]
MRKTRRLKGFILFLVIVVFIAGALFGAFQYVKYKYTVKNVLVEGNIHYTDDEIKDLVIGEGLKGNSLYLSYIYKNKDVEDIPFVETMDVKVVSPDTVRITVYEKILAGYIEFLGQYIYFDKDGIVCEASHVKTLGIPEVIGVKFDYVVMHEVLPAEDKELFGKVLNITKLMEKYGVLADKLYFAKNGDISLYIGDIVASLGNDENIDIKIMNLPGILENLQGKAGVLRMEDYDENTKRVSLEPKKEQ